MIRCDVPLQCGGATKASCNQGGYPGGSAEPLMSSSGRFLLLAKSGFGLVKAVSGVSAVARLGGKESRVGARWEVVFFALQVLADRLPSSARCVSVSACFGPVF